MFNRLRAFLTDHYESEQEVLWQQRHSYIKESPGDLERYAIDKDSEWYRKFARTCDILRFLKHGYFNA